MKSFREYIKEQGPPPEKTSYDYTPAKNPLDMSLDPRDLEVVHAFFRGEPDVVGTNFTTKQDDDGDYNSDELRIDALYGRGRQGVVQLANDIIYLGQLGTMVDDKPEAKQIQSIVRNMARDKDMRVM